MNMEDKNRNIMRTRYKLSSHGNMFRNNTPYYLQTNVIDDIILFEHVIMNWQNTSFMV